ncbi:MAG: hypothetical protein E4G90_05660, partial [Gemmatimonadales bacterium]
MTIGDATREVLVDGERVVVDGTPFQATLIPTPGTPLWRMDLNGHSHLLAARHLGQGRWEVLDRGERVEATVLDERTRHIRGLVGRGKRHGGAGTVRAPMPGLVARVLVSPGDTVVAGSGLVILEA